MENPRMGDVMIDINEKIKNFNYKQDEKVKKLQRDNMARTFSPMFFDGTVHAKSEAVNN